MTTGRIDTPSTPCDSRLTSQGAHPMALPPQSSPRAAHSSAPPPSAEELTRRDVLRGAAAAGIVLAAPGAAAASGTAAESKASPATAKPRGPRVVVIGAGVFGGFTALALRARGAE